MLTKKAVLTTKDSFVLAFNVAKSKKPYTEFIKKNKIEVIFILEPENNKPRKLKNQMPTDIHTIQRCVSVFIGDILIYLQENLSECSTISFHFGQV